MGCNTYAAIGRAVIFAQILETALIPVFEFFKMNMEPGYIEKTGGYIPAGAYKIPVSNIVRALATTGNIAPDLQERLLRYVEDRHVLIHRWVQQHGWPEEDDAEGFAPIVELAVRVEAEAKALTRSLAGHMLKLADPNWVRDHGADYKALVSQLFHQAHIEE